MKYLALLFFSPSAFSAGHQIAFTPVPCPGDVPCNAVTITAVHKNGSTVNAVIMTKLRFSNSEISVTTENGKLTIVSPK